MRHLLIGRPRLPRGVHTYVRGPLLLGFPLALIVIVAIFGALRIYRQLDAAASVEQTLVRAERQLSDVLQAQLGEEAGLRGFLATGQRVFLDPFLSGVGGFDAKVDQLQSTVQPLGMAGFVPLLAEMRLLHGSWEQGVARPLLDAPKAGNAIVRQTLGKELSDRLQADVDHVDELLHAHLLRTERELRRRIDEAVSSILASALLFGLLSVVYVGSRARMLARIGRERTIIETLQGAFRTGWDIPAGLRVGTAYVSATVDAGVGGDLYDVCKLDSTRTLVLVADVSGKGIEAAVSTAFIKYSIRTLARMSDDPARILSEFNLFFMETILEPNLFVSAFVGLVDAQAMTFRYSSGGHSSVYVRRGEGVRQLPVTGPVIGIDRKAAFSARSVELVPMDLFVLSTDGLTEARDASRKAIEDEGAMRLIQAAPSDPQACADELITAVRRHSGGTLSDDLALLVFSVSP